MVELINFGTLSTIGGKTVLTGGSGLDTESLIDSLTEAKRLPAVQLETNLELNSSKTTALGSLQTILQSLRSSVDALRKPTGFGSSSVDAFAARTTFLNASDGTAAGNYMGVVAANDTALGTYTMEIDNLAVAESRKSIAFASRTTSVVGAAGTDVAGEFSAGSFYINGESVTLAEGDTLNDVAQKINAAKDDTGVEATILKVSDTDYRLIMTATETGTENAINIADGGLAFDGVNDEILTNVVALPTGGGTTAFNMQFTMQADQVAAAGESVIVSQEAAGLATDLTVKVDSSGNLIYQVDTTAVATTSGVNLLDNKPHKIEVDRAADGTLTIYVDNVVVATGTHTGNISSDNTLIGDVSDGSPEASEGNFIGNMYDFEISVGGTPVFEYRLDEGSGTTATDSSGMGNDGPVDGAAVFFDGVFPTASDMFPPADVTAAEDAQITLNGTVITRQSNTFSDVVDGLTFSLFQETPTGAPDTTISVEVAKDSNVVSDAVLNFVNAYNDFRVFQAQQNERDAEGNFVETAVLKDSILLDTVADRIVNLIATSVNGDLPPTLDDSNIPPTRLGDIGLQFADFPGDPANDIPLTTNILEFDAAKFSSKLESFFDELKDVFEFSLTTTSTNLQIFDRPTVSSSEDYTIVIDDTQPVGSQALVTHIDGQELATPLALEYNTTDPEVTGSVTAVLKGEVGTGLEGLEIFYFGDGTETSDFAATFNNGEKEYTLAVDDGQPVGSQATITHIHGLQLTTAIALDYDTSSGNPVISGVDDSFLDGFEFLYFGDGTDNIDIAFKQGIADKLFNDLDDIIDGAEGTSQGLVADEIDNIEAADETLTETIARIDAQVDRFRLTLLDRFGALEAAVATANSILTLLDSQVNAANN